MTITVNRPGLLTSIQDLGRYGFQKYGVIVSGAMDRNSLRIANMLAGNKEGNGVLEITLMGPSLLFEEDTLIALTGADMSPEIDGEAVPLWRPVYVKKGSVLDFKACRTGCRTYLALAGGFALEEVMNSQSTYLRGEMGGYKGRALKAGDQLEAKEMSPWASKLFHELKAKAGTRSFLTPSWQVQVDSFVSMKKNPVIRAIRGGEFDRFTKESQTRFFEHSFRITPKSDRMGYRIEGPALQLEQPFELLSEAVAYGTVQVPNDGNPIILLADRQTTGGYPKIAQIATVDLPVIAQLKPGENIRFQEITLEEAEQLYLKQEQELEQLQAGIALKNR